MGKGDIKTKRGKLSNRSYGVRRPKKRVRVEQEEAKSKPKTKAKAKPKKK